MKLLGAKQFITMPRGTYYVKYSLDSVQECHTMIENFKKEPANFSNFYNLEIYGGNPSSMCFSEYEDHYIFDYDANVVGDATPETTLYITFEFNEIPKNLCIIGFNGTICIPKDKLQEIQEKYLDILPSCDDYLPKWVESHLKELSTTKESIVDFIYES